MVLECLEGADLYDFLIKRDFDITEQRCKEIALGIATGIKYLHDFGVVHRDIKLENILMTNKDTATSQPKLTDFGLSVMLGPGKKVRESCGTIVRISDYLRSTLLLKY